MFETIIQYPFSRILSAWFLEYVRFKIIPPYVSQLEHLLSVCLGSLGSICSMNCCVFLNHHIWEKIPIMTTNIFQNQPRKVFLCGHRCDTRHACEGFVNNLAIKTCFSVLHVASWSLRENIFQPSDFVLSHVAYLHYLIPCLRLILAESS